MHDMVGTPSIIFDTHSFKTVYTVKLYIFLVFMHAYVCAYIYFYLCMLLH